MAFRKIRLAGFSTKINGYYPAVEPDIIHIGLINTKIFRLKGRLKGEMSNAK